MGNFDFDIDLREGLAREGTLAALLHDATIEVKSQVRCSEYGYVFIEYESRGKPSGIAMTKATHWAIEVSPDWWVIVPTETLKSLARRALRMRGPSTGGDEGTSTGALVPLGWLLPQKGDR